MWHLSWRANGDSFDVGLLANRALARGHRVVWLEKPDGAAEAGDYLIDAGAADLARAAGTLGVTVSRWTGREPAGALALARPSLALFTGEASGYPYFAYYSLSLARLGFAYSPADGKDLAKGTLDSANLFVIPGGFATWGFDQAESAPGADAKVRDFLGRGGAAIGSCGGAFYLSAGRPGWTGSVMAVPRYTHEYLTTGVGVVAVDVAPSRLTLGCPTTMEVPYYHGPVHEEVGPEARVIARFKDLRFSGRLGIENPLDPGLFEREMKGRPAVIEASGLRGRAILFSPHPEMGDLLRKYMSLDGYVRKYLPIRGRKVMDETLTFYRSLDAPCFRLLLNAAHALAADKLPAVAPSAPAPTAAELHDGIVRVKAATEEAWSGLGITEDDGFEGLVHDIAGRLKRDLAPAFAALDPVLARLASGDPWAAQIAQSWHHVAGYAEAGLRADRQSNKPVAAKLLGIELAIRLAQAWGMLARADLACTQADGRA
ncbi:MAG: hypothetical protein FJX35_01340 [Alphaproteobacteria bacterium]|nr:hypothetical protein [Alphaproteobacteria bacterium]